ncbi:MAG: MFS transporter [Clostridia bacterium]|nr:MFS transporter [Clostridia bacterium]
MLLTLATGAAMANYAFAPISPFLARELCWGKTEIGLLGAAGATGTMVFAVASGLGVDRLGPRWFMLVGPLVMGLGCLGLSSFGSFTSALAWSFLVGVGFSTLTPMSNRAIYEWFPERGQAFAIGLKQAGIPLGTAAAALLFTAVSEQHGWRASYRAASVTIAALGMVAFLCYRDPLKRCPAHAEGGAPPDGPAGAVHVSCAMASCAAAGMAFAMWQISLTTFLVAYLQEVLGMPLAVASRLLALTQVGGGAARPWSGAISDILWHGRRKPLIVLLGLANLVCILVLTEGRSVLAGQWLTPFMLVLGAVTMGWFGPFFALMVEAYGRQKAGLASGLAATLNLVGQTLGAPLFGYVVDVTGSFRPALLLFVGLMAAATAAYWAWGAEAPERE